MPQPLSSKDQASFRQLVKFYEAKQHKKAIKTADQLLKKNPNHGDTKAMKALTLNAMGQTDEAFELGKVALQHDIKSYICWHVYGLLYRSIKNYEEAIKAYRFALKLEPDSAQILRDLAFLQAQMRDYEGYIQSRKSMLQSKPFQRANWTSLAVAYHLNGQLEAAENTLKTYEDTLKQAPSLSDTEHSETAMYRNSIIEELGENERALEHLEGIAKVNLDRTAVMEARARLLLKLGRLEDAQQAYRDLLARNNEYRLYYESLEKALDLDRSKKEDVPKLIELYESFASRERSDAPTRIPLDFLEGDNFKTAANAYLTKMLTKGVPSTFANVKSLYADKLKRDIILDLVKGYLENPPITDGVNGTNPTRLKEACLYFLAQHYNYSITRDYSKALEYIDQAIELDPKSVVYMQTKGRIYKHLGNTVKAAEIMEKARKTDEKDRYINTKCGKYQLRNNENDLAIKTMAKFTRNEAVGGALGDLLDMQCIWYLTEDGEAFQRRGKLGLALKRFKAIYDIFDTWQEDQFDFHHFSMRKGAARAYMDMIRWMDRLREHPFFTRAAVDAVNVYVKLADSADTNGAAHGIPNLDKMDASERKKALKKAKREQEKEEKARKAEEERAGAKDGQKSSKKDPDGTGRKEDPDPNGSKLVSTKTPLEDAMPYVSYLLEFSPKSIKGQLASFDVFIRRKKLLMALKCLNAAHQIEPEHPGLHERLVQYRKALDSAEEQPPKVVEVLKSCSSVIPAASGLIKFNDEFAKRHSGSLPHQFAALRVRRLLDPSDTNKAACQKEVLATLDSSNGASALSDVEAGFVLLKEWRSNDEVMNTYLAKARQKWPEATIFAE